MYENTDWSKMPTSEDTAVNPDAEQSVADLVATY